MREADTSPQDGGRRRLVPRLSPVEAVALAYLAASLFLISVSGRRYYWILPECGLIVAKMALWAVPAVAVAIVADVFGWAARSRRLVLLAYYLLLTIALIGTQLEASLIRTHYLSRMTRMVREVGVLSLACMVLLAVALAVGWYRHRERTVEVLRGQAVQLVYALRLLVALVFLFVAYSNLKAAIPLLRPGLYDGWFYRLDRVLMLGHDPLELVSRIRWEWFATLMKRSYFFLFFFVLFGLSGAFVFRSALYMERTMLALLLVYVVGTMGYYLAPSVGPAFFNETSRLFRHTADSPLKLSLYNAYVQFCRHPYTAAVFPFNGLAAFPSLHVAQMAVLLYSLSRIEKALVWMLVLPCILLTVATVYLGWHYVVDIPGGLLVAWIAGLLSRQIYKRWPLAARSPATVVDSLQHVG